MLIILSVIVFVASVLLFGGQYLYKFTLLGQAESLKGSIEIAKSKFEPGTLEELSRIDAKIVSLKELLGQHTSLTPLFALLEASTLQAVRFRSFDYAVQDGRAPEIRLTGDSNGYAAIALQSDSFSKTGKFKNIVFSELRLDDKGRVQFLMSATVDPSLLVVPVLAGASAGVPAVAEPAGAESAENSSTEETIEQ